MLCRAYSQLTIKAFDDATREFSGIASTPTPDAYGDIVEPLGAKFSLPMPLLWQHQHDKPVGEVYYAKPTKAGIPIKARIFQAKQSKTLIERLDEAWESLKLGLVRGLSIGFSPLEYSQIENSFSYHFLEWDWYELSPVTIPANMDAGIQNIKSIARRSLAASGRSGGAVYLDDHRRVCRSGAVYLKRPVT